MSNRVMLLAVMVLAPVLGAQSAYAAGPGETLAVDTNEQQVCVNFTHKTRTIEVPKGYEAKLYDDKDCQGKVVYETDERRIAHVPASARSVLVHRGAALENVLGPAKDSASDLLT
ncbi:hypothetical protein [Streptomyces sp. SP18CS02]|uniref:hypothetical protein n=1 Tax=Streptomyces sp. SP18CS02 TaxID=3002531 RepID=UPI002E784D1C|nr:hypothetical protein [Streptomyces sp. SP18CS02]MEE1753140.1 hypothetical protein [Streptomyces sp. SP18CS02]